MPAALKGLGGAITGLEVDRSMGTAPTFCVSDSTAALSSDPVEVFVVLRTSGGDS
jgi:hypothetical protein